jgi:hypothetical protein
MGAAQIALIASQPLPKFAKGGTVKGGQPGKDSVPAMLMPGEEVVNTKASEQHRPLLKAINEHRPITPDMLQGLNLQVREQGQRRAAAQMDTAELVAAIQAQGTFRDVPQPSVQVQADEEGFSTYVQGRGHRTRYVGGRFSG